MTTFTTGILLTCLLLPLAASAADAPATQPSQQSLRLSTVIVHDPQINNAEAVRFLAPADWKVEGGVRWRLDTWLLASLDMRLSDPASRTSVTIHPGDTFTWSVGAAQLSGGNPARRYLGSLVMRLPDSATDTITRLVAPTYDPETRTAQITATQDLPDLAKSILTLYQEPGFNKACQAARVRYAYNDPADGTPMEEDVYAVIITTPMPAIATMNWHLERAYTVRAPRGHLDALAPVLTTMLTSARLGADWLSGYQYVVQLRNAGVAQATASAAALSRHIAENSEEIRRMNQQSYEAAQRTHDATARAFSQSIRGVDDYALPNSSSPVELPSGYDHAYYDPTTDQYLLSNDPHLDPAHLQGHWTEIQRTPSH